MPDPLYDRGDTAKLNLLSRLVDGGPLTDPATLTLSVRSPAGVTDTHTHPGAPIVRDAAGTFHADIALTEAGTWTYQWQTTNPGQVQGGELLVAAAPLDDPDTLTDVEMVRLEIDDTASPTVFTDRQIAAKLTQRGTVLAAAADLLDILAARAGQNFDFKWKDGEFKRSQVAAALRARAQAVRARSETASSGLQVVGVDRTDGYSLHGSARDTPLSGTVHGGHEDPEWLS